jgi:hypothetical protein
MEGWASFARTAPVDYTSDESQDAWPGVVGLFAGPAMAGLGDLPSLEAEVVGAIAAGERPTRVAQRLGLTRREIERARLRGLAALRELLGELPDRAARAEMLRTLNADESALEDRMARLESATGTLAVKRATRNSAPRVARAQARHADGKLQPDRAAAAALLARVPAGTAATVEITPAVAVALLERNVANRAIARHRVARFAADIAAGAWEVNNNGLGIGADGQLYDGQHRLHAVILANRPAKMLIVRGLSPEARATIDQGRPRSVGDNLRILDGESQGVRIVSWLNTIEVLVTRKGAPLSHAMVRARLAKREAAVRWFLENAPRSRPFHRASVIGALVFAHPAAPHQVEEFTRGYGTGADLREGSPILVLRDYVVDPVRLRADDSRIVSLKTLRCVLAHLKDERIERLHPGEDVVDFFRGAAPPAA